MNSLPRLTPRLAAVADMVRRGGVVADIGTDHAYLPVYLVKSGLNPSACACDINEGPLERAKKTIRAYDAQEQVSVLLCDGLDGVEFANDIVIAGMGGEMIAKILGRCQFIKNPDVALVLQPMTAVQELRKFLCLSGFEIKKEQIAKENTKFYVVMAVAFTGKAFAPDELFCLTGLLPQSGGVLERDYLLREAGKLKIIAQGLAASAHRQAQANSFEILADKVKQIALTCMRSDANDKSE